jgi:KDO2-lipid IV(A) lauroyltransferase
MTLTAGPDKSGQTRVRIAPPEQLCGPFRQNCATFWLNVMFFLSRKLPWFVRSTRGFFLWWAWTFSKHFQDATVANARHLLGPDSSMAERRRLGKRIVGSFYDFISDIGRTTRLPREQLRQLIAEINGKEAYQKIRGEGKGVIIATAHMGSFELGMTAMLEVEKRIHVVFQRDGHSLFEKLRSEFRERLGIMEAAVDDGWGIWMRLREALAADEVVAIQADRAMPGQIGVKVPFLDGHALFPEGPAKLAAITGAPIVPVFVIRLADGSVRIFIEEAIRISDPSDIAIAHAIATLAQVVGRYAKQFPDQWLVVNRAWCEDMASNAGEH